MSPIKNISSSELDHIERLDAIAELVRWVKPLFITLVLGAFTLGGWVATLQVTMNGLIEENKEFRKELAVRSERMNDQIVLITEVKTELLSVKEQLQYIRSALTEKR